MEIKEKKKPAHKKPSFYIGIVVGIVLFKLIDVVYNMYKDGVFSQFAPMDLTQTGYSRKRNRSCLLLRDATDYNNAYN